jgi:acyl carrier protein
VLAHQTRESFAEVLRPKLEGAYLLDRLTRSLPIEHFVLFSSSASLLGSAAQANHAAANAALDALAERRRSAGLPAISIAWGAWADIGAAARASATVARRGLLPMPPDDALAAMAQALGSDSATVGVLDIDWPRFLERFPPGLLPPRFAAFASPAAYVRTISQVAEARSLREELAALPQAERASCLLAHVGRTVAKILGLPPDEPPPTATPLRELGLDSLMTIELRNALATDCATRLPATLVFQHPTISALAEHLGGTVFADLLPAAADALDDLDAEALARLLEQELGAADAQLAGMS